MKKRYQELYYKRLFSIIKLINFDLSDNKKKKSVKELVDDRVVVENEDSLKKDLYNYFCLSNNPKSTCVVKVYTTTGEQRGVVWTKQIQNSKKLAKWFGETVADNIARATPEVGVDYIVE